MFRKVSRDNPEGEYTFANQTKQWPMTQKKAASFWAGGGKKIGGTNRGGRKRGVRASLGGMQGAEQAQGGRWN